MLAEGRKDYITPNPDGSEPYIYEGSADWTNSPLVQLSSIRDADYPPLILLRQEDAVKVEFPEYDMFIREEGKPPILFTGAHSRLLYEIQQGLGAPNSDRVIVNVDAHTDRADTSDVYNHNYIHIGNWGYKGERKNYWRNFVYVSKTLEEPGRFSRDRLSKSSTVYVWEKESKRRIYTAAYHEIDFSCFVDEAIQEIQRIVDGRSYILSIEADEFAAWGKRRYRNDDIKLTDSDKLRLYALVTSLLPDPNMELLNFTASPAYCPAVDARAQWEIVR